MDKRKHPLWLIGLFQALCLVGYCSLIAFFMFNANKWFGKAPNYFGPLLFLMLFTTSAFISALIVGAYPFILYFNKKQTRDAIKLAFYTAAWLLVLVLTVITIIIFQK